MTVTNMVAAAGGAAQCSVPGACPHGTAYCVSPHGPLDVCEGPAVALTTRAGQQMVAARLMDFGFPPGSDACRPDPILSVDATADMLELNDPADVFALADDFAAFAAKLRDLGDQLAVARSCASAEVTG